MKRPGSTRPIYTTGSTGKF